MHSCRDQAQQSCVLITQAFDGVFGGLRNQGPRQGPGSANQCSHEAPAIVQRWVETVNPRILLTPEDVRKRPAGTRGRSLNPIPWHSSRTSDKPVPVLSGCSHHLGHMNRIGIEALIRPRPLTIRLEHPGLLQGIPPAMNPPPGQQGLTELRRSVADVARLSASSLTHHCCFVVDRARTDEV